jgi:hypothetical protein
MSPFPPSSRRGLLCQFCVVCLIILGLGALMSQAALAQNQPADQVKAAFLFNFVKFIEWPPGTFADDRAAIILGFLHGDPLAGALEALRGKVVQNRPLEIKPCRALDEVKQCQIFFASASTGALPQVLRALKNSPVLTVTDGVDNFAKLGGIINLIIVEDKVRFEICVDNARQSRLTISSQLLKLAKLVNN